MGISGKKLENEGLEYLRQGMESISPTKVCLKDFDKNSKNLETLLKSILNENDYEYIRALINGEEPKNNPIDLEKLKVLKPYIAQIYIRKSMDNYTSIYDSLLKIVDEDLLNETVIKK